MTETSNLALPLVQAAQAQKHVTVNEALTRLDGMAQLVIQSDGETTPPVGVADGLVWSVASGAVNAWAGRDGALALSSNGGWVFITPQTGWHAFVVSRGTVCRFSGGAWAPHAVATSLIGAATLHEVITFDEVINAGTSATTDNGIPANTVVMGVTGRVKSAISGTLTDWDLGVAGSSNRYGSGWGLPQNSWIRGLTGVPTTYYDDTPLVLRANGGAFAGGEVRFAVHCLSLKVPDLI